MKLKKKTLEFELEVGDEAYLKNGCYLGYAGMPSKEVFSVIHTEKANRQFLWGGYAHSKNLFHPISKKEINYYSHHFEILEVNPEKIRLKYKSNK